MRDAAADTVLILGNPFSGAGKNARRVNGLIEALRAAGFDPRVEWDRAQWARLFADEAFSRSCRCVVAAGGDGTVAEVLNLRPTIPLAVLPLGTENLFARRFGFSGDPRKTARRIATGRPAGIDLGCANGALFSLVVSAGFDAEVVHRLARWRAVGTHAGKQITHLNYLPFIGGALREYDYPPVAVEADDGHAEGAHAFVMNIPRYGLGLPIAPEAREDDGLLDWVVLKRPGGWALAGYAASIAMRRHLRRGDVAHGRTTRLRITSPASAPAQRDGDPAGRTPLEIAVQPQAVRVMRRA